MLTENPAIAPERLDHVPPEAEVAMIRNSDPPNPATGATPPGGGNWNAADVPTGVKEIESSMRAPSPGSMIPSGELTGVFVPAMTSVQESVWSTKGVWAVAADAKITPRPARSNM
jgi:hypothetical protein